MRHPTTMEHIKAICGDTPVGEALQRLKPKSEALLRMLIDGCSIKQVAARFKISPSMVYVLRKGALYRLAHPEVEPRKEHCRYCGTALTTKWVRTCPVDTICGMRQRRDVFLRYAENYKAKAFNLQRTIDLAEREAALATLAVPPPMIAVDA